MNTPTTPADSSNATRPASKRPGERRCFPFRGCRKWRSLPVIAAVTSTNPKPRRSRQPGVLAAAVLTSGLLAGCGLHDPAAAYYGTTTSKSSKAAVNPTPAPERGGTIPQSDKPQLAVTAASASPAAALERYANLACNWTWANVAARQRQLVDESLGQARSNAQQALAELAADRTLAANSIVNRCQIVSLARGAGPAKGQWVLVLTQSTSGSADYSSLPATLHVIYAATAHESNGYTVTRWAAQD
jgi:hypothetical protein